MTDQLPHSFRASDSPLLAEIRHAYSRMLAHASIECGTGWLPLLQRLCAQLAELEQQSGLPVLLSQIKEKYGVLRIYYDQAPAGVDALIEAAEAESQRICELCGKPGSPCSGRGYVKTFCLEHRQEHNYAVIAKNAADLP